MNTRCKIEEGTHYIGYGEALNLVRSHVHPMDAEFVPTEEATGRILAEDLSAKVDSPSLDVSLRDGYAIFLDDPDRAKSDKALELRILGSVYAGDTAVPELLPNSAVKITTGAPLPQRAQSVIASEFCHEQGDRVFISGPIQMGQHILRSGTDVRKDSVIGTKGEWLSQGKLGLITAAGIHHMRVVKIPTVGIIATGNELAALGEELRPGQIYPSNMVTLASWLYSFGIKTISRVVSDTPALIEDCLSTLLDLCETLVISGGAWGSERDFVIRVLTSLGWKKVFHRVRMEPGKGVAFGLFDQKPIFCLPGGPAGNEMAFLQLALPGILWQAGWEGFPFGTLQARMATDLTGRRINWTKFVRAHLSQDTQGTLRVTPHRPESRLRSMALTSCLIPIPEGIEGYGRGELVEVQVLCTRSFLSRAME